MDVSVPNQGRVVNQEIVGGDRARQLSRLSGVDQKRIRNERADPQEAQQVAAAQATLRAVVDRVHFLTSPVTSEDVEDSARAFDARFIVLDYLQRIASSGGQADKRAAVDAALDRIRILADTGAAVLVVSVLARTKNKKGQSSYDVDWLGLASFRESGELGQQNAASV